MPRSRAAFLALPLCAAVTSGGWALREARPPEPRKLPPPPVRAARPAMVAAPTVEEPPPPRRAPRAEKPLLPRIALVHGKALFADGEPATETTVTFDGGPHGELRVNTDDQGQFVAAVAAGDYQVSCSNDGEAAEVRLALASGQEVTDFNLYLSQPRERPEE
jgi:hypothetical protein